MRVVVRGFSDRELLAVPVRVRSGRWALAGEAATAVASDSVGQADSDSAVV